MTTTLTVNRVLLVDDHPSVLLGITEFLKPHPEFAVCGTARTAQEAQIKLFELQPDIVILDLLLPGESGLSLISRLRANGCQIPLLAYSGVIDPTMPGQARKAGASAFVHKLYIEDLVPVMRSLLDRPVPEPAVASLAAAPTQAPAPEAPAKLSQREQEVLRALAKGWSVDQIAKQFGVSRDTIYTHCRRMCLKLGCATTRDLTVRALRPETD